MFRRWLDRRRLHHKRPDCVGGGGCWTGVRTAAAYFALLAVIGLPPAAGQVPATGDTPLEQLVRRLQLDRLRIALLEDQLSTAAPENRLQVARELAPLYLQLVYARGERGETADDVQQKLRGLLHEFPALDEPKLKTAMLYGDFARVENSFRAALDAPQQPGLRETARTAAQNFLQQLEQSGLLGPPGSAADPADHSQTAGKTAAGILFLDEARPAPTEPEDEGWRDQLHYVQAWTLYYAGALADEAATREADWQQANRLFRQILQIPAANDLRDIQDGWLDLSPSSLARTALGLALSEQALGHDDQASTCFRWLQGADAYPELRRHWLTWRINSFLFAGQLQPLRAWLEREGPRGDLAREDFAALAYAGDLADRMRKARPDQANEFATLLESLTKFLIQQNRLEVVDQWMRSGLIEPEKFRDDFARRLLAGRKLFLQAEASGSPADYEAADRQFESALKIDSTELTPRQSAQVTFLRGWCLLRAQQYQQAIVQFRLAQRLADPWDAEFAAQAAWMTIECQLRSATPGSEPAGQIEQALRRFQERYPTSPLIDQAQFAAARWAARSSADPAAMAKLENMERTNLQWAAGQLEAARLHHAAWTAATREGAEPTAAAVVVAREALQRIAQRLAEDRQADPRAAAQALLLWVDAELNDPKSPAETWQPLLDRIAAILGEGTVPPAMAVDWEWQQFRAARRRGDTDASRQLAEQLANQTVSPLVREAAFLYLADENQQAIAGVGESERAAAQRTALAFYQRMTAALGTTPADLTRSRNAFLALQRLGDLELALGDVAAADQHFSELLNAAPRDLGALQRSATAKQRLEQWPAATELWRTIARGVDPGSEPWLEAKYQLVVCLQKTGAANARDVLEQTLQLMPQLSGTWQTRFHELRATLPAESER